MSVATVPTQYLGPVTRDHEVRVRLTAAEKEHLAVVAAENRVSVAEAVRRACFGDQKSLRFDLGY
jgi:hypothetical protein